MTSIMKRISVAVLTAALTLAMLPAGFTAIAYADTNGTGGSATGSVDGSVVLQSEGETLTNTWVEDGNGWYWVGPDGCMVRQTKWLKVADDWYHITGGYRDHGKWMKDSKGWCYLGDDGRMVVNGWAKDSKGWCWIGADGYMVVQTKWFKIGADWYHITKGYRDQSKWMKDSKGWCYLSADGKMVANGWAKDSKGWCWIGASGYMVEKTQWFKIGADWYHITNGYRDQSKWMKDSKGWCYLDAGGKMVANGWAKDSKGWCYIGANGYMVTTTGWITDRDKAYYLSKGYCISDDRGVPKKPDDTVPATIDGVTEANTYYFDGSTWGVSGAGGDSSTYSLKTVLAISTPTKVVLSGTIQFDERYKVGSNTEIDATGATLYCADRYNDGCLTNEVPSCDYDAVENIIVRGGTWKKASGYHDKTMFFFVHGSNIRVEDATVECSYSGHCIELVACENVVVKGCDLQMHTGTPGEDEPMQIDHASVKSAPTITNLNANAANGHACKNIQIMDSKMIGGRGLCAGHAANDPACADVYHEYIYVENNVIEGKGAEGCALFNVYNVAVSGNEIKASGGAVDNVNSCALHIQIPQNSKAPSDMNKAAVLIMNNKCYGGRNGILVYSHSDYESQFGRTSVFGNSVWYKGTETAAINWGGWNHIAGRSFNGVPDITLSNNTLKKGW